MVYSYCFRIKKFEIIVIFANGFNIMLWWRRHNHIMVHCYSFYRWLMIKLTTSFRLDWNLEIIYTMYIFKMSFQIFWFDQFARETERKLWRLILSDSTTHHGFNLWRYLTMLAYCWINVIISIGVFVLILAVRIHSWLIFKFKIIKTIFTSKIKEITIVYTINSSCSSLWYNRNQTARYG